MTATSHVIVRRDSWQTAWRIVVSDRLLASSALLTVLLLALTVALPQTPYGNPAAYARWLSDTQIHFGSLAEPLITLGLFDVVRSIFFRAALGLLAFVLSARLIDRLHDLRSASRPIPPPDPASHSLETGHSPDEIAARLRRYRIRKMDAYVIADRFPLAQLGSIAAHIGPLIILAGLALSPLTDWRADTLSILPGAKTPVPNTPYRLDASGIDASGQTGLTLLQDDIPIARGVAAPGRPWITSNVSVFVRERLPALRVSGTDTQEKPLALQSNSRSAASNELLLTFDADHQDGFFAAPDAKLAVRVSMAKPDAFPQYKVSVFSTADARPVADATIPPFAPVEANGARFTFGDEHHVVVAVVHAPAQVIVVFGLIATFAGLLSVISLPAHRIWIVPQATGSRVVCDDPDFDLSRITAEGNRP